MVEVEPTKVENHVYNLVALYIVGCIVALYNLVALYNKLVAFHQSWMKS